MKAYCIEKPNIFKQTDLTLPVCEKDGVIINVKYVGLCGSDLHSYLGISPMVKYPVIPGHEISGVITDVGADVKNLSVGQTVTVLPYFNCGTCYPCREGRPNCCEHNQTLGVQRNGVFSEYFAVNEKHVIPSPLSHKLTALIEPFSIGRHAAERLSLNENDCTAVFGCGAVGIGVMLSAHAMGAHVIACDIDEEKLCKVNKLFGFDTFLITDDKEKLFALTDGRGITSAVDATGSSKTLPYLLEIINFAGKAVIVGYANGITGIESKLIVSKELNLFGSRNADKGDFENVIKMLEKAEFDYSVLISSVIPFTDAGTAFDYWRENRKDTVKILIEM